jgi:hypothetical protein
MSVRTVSDEDASEPGGDASVDPRMRSAWRAWLSALATDAEAAMAAALAYEALPPEGRDAWLDALAADAPGLGVPLVALYAPLLGVESDEARRARMLRTLETDAAPVAVRRLRALHAVAPGGEHVCAILTPLYLDFVELLVCRYDPDSGVTSARRDPVRHVSELVRDATPGAPTSYTVDGIAAFEAPVQHVIEGLAHAVVADRRGGRDAPSVLTGYAHLFGTDPTVRHDPS